MSNKKILIIMFLVSPLLLASNLLNKQDEPKKHGYVGVKVCGMCHKSEKQGGQLGIWKKSKHAMAFKTLQTEKADSIAKKLGHDTPAAKTEACLKCHVTAYNVDASLLGKRFNKEDGVQCETCHGPGADYKSLKIMKNKDKAIANGLIIHEDHEKFCATCHNSDSPTYVARDFKEMWNKIKHPIPKKK